MDSKDDVEELKSLARSLGMNNENENAGGERPEMDCLSQQDCQHPQQREDQQFQQEEEEESVNLVDEEIEVNEEVSEEFGGRDEERHHRSDGQSLMEKERKFEKLKSLVAERRIYDTAEFQCPLEGCGIKQKYSSDILKHLCAIHFNSELEEKRKAERRMYKKQKRNVCAICGKTLGTKTTLYAHYGVVHKDLADVALDRVMLDAQQWKERQQQRRNQEQQPGWQQESDMYGEEGGAGDGGAMNESALSERRGKCSEEQSIEVEEEAGEKDASFIKALEGEAESRRIADEEDGYGQDAVSDTGKVNPYPFPTSVVVLERLEVAEVPTPAAGTAEERLNIVRNLCHRYNRDLRLIPSREGTSFKCFWCPLCDRVQSSMGGLLEHLCCLHLQKDIAERRKEEMEEKKCHECNLAFSSRYNARIHFGIQHGELAGPFMELPRIKALAAKQQQQHKRTFQ